MAGPSSPFPETRWEHLPHDADIGVRGCGPTMAAAFEQAALALTAVVTDPAHVALREVPWSMPPKRPGSHARSRGRLR